MNCGILGGERKSQEVIQVILLEMILERHCLKLGGPSRRNRLKIDLLSRQSVEILSIILLLSDYFVEY